MLRADFVLNQRAGILAGYAVCMASNARQLNFDHCAIRYQEDSSVFDPNLLSRNGANVFIRTPKCRKFVYHMNYSIVDVLSTQQLRCINAWTILREVVGRSCVDPNKVRHGVCPRMASTALLCMAHTALLTPTNRSASALTGH